MSDYVNTWGRYPWWSGAGDHLIHPDERTTSRDMHDRYAGKVFYCSEVTSDGYLVLHDASHRYRVKPDIYQVVPTPAFKYGDHVREKDNPERNGMIYNIGWHSKRACEFYNLHIGEKYSTKRCFSDELELVEENNE